MQQDKAQSLSATAHHPSIMLVDDEASIRVAMQRWLSRRGWTVVTCANGQEALALLEQDDAEARFDAILCDLRMPGISGVHLHDWLRDTKPVMYSRLVLATGDVASGEIARFLATVTCPVIEKPFDFDLLARTIDALVSK